MAREPLHYRDTRDRDTFGGFALIEVMLALMLIAVLAALAMPGLIRTTGPAALRVAAFQVSAILREDRNVAQSTGRVVATRLYAGGRSIASGTSSAAIDLPPGAAAHLVDATAPDIRFFANGQSSGGTILIQSASARYLVVVSRDTGAIRVGEP